MTLTRQVAHRLKILNRTLSTAESCTGGLLAHRLTNIPGSSNFFTAGVVAYSNRAKQQFLKTPAGMLKKHGAVSAPVAKQMARNIRKLFKTDYGIGITGIAGPTGGTPQKPVGLVHIAVASGRHIRVKKYRLEGTRVQIKRQAVDMALKQLLNLMR